MPPGGSTGDTATARKAKSVATALADTPLESKTDGQIVHALWTDALEYRKDYNLAIGEELEFSLKQRHYVDDAGETQNRLRIQPKGRELTSKLRHKSAEITNELFLTVRPGEPDDPEQPPAPLEQSVEQARTKLQNFLHDPFLDYAQCREDMVMLAIAARIGYIAFDVMPGLGAGYGYRIVPRVGDPRKLFWTPGWKSPHDPTCPWVMEVKRMLISDIRRMKAAGWKNTDDVKPDEGSTNYNVLRNDGVTPGNVRLPNSSAGTPGPGKTQAEPRATIIHCWFRYSDKTYDTPVDAPPRPLREENRYLRCNTCGYEDKSQPGKDLSPTGQPCPQCAQMAQQVGMDPSSAPPMERVDAEQDTEQVLAYPRGQEIIVAPFSDDLELRNGEWQYRIRSVPFIVTQGYPHPLEQIGLSDTAYDWSLQLISDALMRQAYEQMSENRDLIIAPVDGLVDAFNEPWQFADTQGRVAYWTGQGSPNISHFQGTGVPNGWMEVFGQVQNVLMRDMGTSDIAIGSENTRNIPVGTIKAMQETGEVPVQHHKRRLWRAESIGFSVLLDLICDLDGSGPPDAHVHVTAAPSINSVDQNEISALIQVFQAPPPIQDILARKLGIPAHEMEEFQQKVAAQNQSQPPVAPDKLLVAISDILKAQPSFVSYDQVQQALGMAGIKAQPMNQSQQMLHAAGVHKSVNEASAPQVPQVADGGMPFDVENEGAPSPDGVPQFSQ